MLLSKLNLLCLRQRPLTFAVLTLLFWGPGVETNRGAEPKQHRLCIMDRDGANRKVLFSHDEYFTMGSPSMSADGKFIAMDAWKSQEGERSSKSLIFVIKSDGSDLQILGPGAMPTWSPRGKRIVFSQYANPRGVHIMRADGSDRKLLDAKGWSGQWSPDGSMIAMTMFGRNPNIKVYHLIEDEYHSVFPSGETPYRMIYWNLKWSPDSRRLCAKVRKDDGTFEVVTVNAWADEPKLRVHYTTAVQPYVNFAWHPGGKQILFGLRPPDSKVQRIFSFDPNKDDEPVLFKNQDPKHASGDMCWSHDGKQLIYVARDD